MAQKQAGKVQTIKTPARSHTEKQAEQMKPKTNLYIWIGCILFITYICYQPLFSQQKQFTNWDDYEYVTDQPLIKELNAENVSELLTPSNAVMYNYHPLTMISLAMDYERAYNEYDQTIDIKPFATTNLILHLLNTALVFTLVYTLSKKKIWAAAFSSLLFAIHPMHVESVAWISERKDVLYCFFFLLSCLTYIKYLDTKKFLFITLTFVFFLASCLSKAMATPLPLVLLLIDFHYKRRITKQAIFEKIPFFLLAIIIGINAIKVQEGAIGETFSFGQRILFASYGFCMYLFKFIVPGNLSAFYPYPTFVGEGKIPGYYYAMPFVALAVVALPFILSKRNKSHSRDLIWGAGFFVLMIALVLQFISVGQAIMADRYTYLAYIGPLFIASMYFQDLADNAKWRRAGFAFLGIVTSIFGVLTYQRVQVWHSSKSLWTDVIKQYPYELTRQDGKTEVKTNGIKTAYKNLGDYYAGQQMYDSAFIYFNTLAQAQTRDPQVWTNLGNIYAIKNELSKATEAYTKAITYDSTNYETYLARGVVYSMQKDYAAAIKDMDKITTLAPDFEQAKQLKVKWTNEMNQ